MAYGAVSDRSPEAVLFSGETALGPLLVRASDYSVGALVLLVSVLLATLLLSQGLSVMPLVIVSVVVAHVVMSFLTRGDDAPQEPFPTGQSPSPSAGAG